MPRRKQFTKRSSRARGLLVVAGGLDSAEICLEGAFPISTLFLKKCKVCATVVERES